MNAIDEQTAWALVAHLENRPADAERLLDTVRAGVGWKTRDKLEKVLEKIVGDSGDRH